MRSAVSFIESKRDGKSHSREELEAFVESCLSGRIPDYQIAAWLMAVFFRGMDDGELAAFTLALADSGQKVVFPDDIQPVDKHSTGGVGDKTTLVVVPLAAACGVPVAKISGRGLGFTGGTIDKLESIPGFSAHLEMSDFIRQVRTIGCAVSGHSRDLAPAEALFYETRDVTATVPSLPLIASSIISKKIAGGSKSFVFDVKCGSGAFMRDAQEARTLASLLVALAGKTGFPSTAIITGMDQPLGRWVGNAAEVNEAIEVLSGGGPSDTRKLCLEIAGAMIDIGNSATSPGEGFRAAGAALASGKGLERFIAMVTSQGGAGAFEKPDSRLPLARTVVDILSPGDGVVTACRARSFGEAVRLLGGGRFTKEDSIRYDAAVEVICKKGAKVSRGDVLARLYVPDGVDPEGAVAMIGDAFETGERADSVEIIGEVISGDAFS